MMKHILSAEQYNRSSLQEVFELANKIKSHPKDFSNKLSDKIIAVMFYEPSTRTRLSFETAALKLGAKIITTENAGSSSSASKGETIQDTVRVIAGYADALVMRHKSETSAIEAASVNKIPILNGGAGKGEHPTQALLDLFTIQDKIGHLDNLKVAIMGDLVNGRTIHSLIKMLAMYDNVHIYGLSKEAFALPQKYIEMLKERNVEYTKCHSFSEMPKDLDDMYHTRIQ